MSTSATAPALEYSYSDNRGPKLLVTIWSLTALALIFLVARIYIKCRLARLWWDDYLLIGSWVASLITTCANTYCVSQGEGRHLVFLSPKNAPHLFVMGDLTGTTTAVGGMLSKTAFAITLMRLLYIQDRVMTIALWFVIIFINLVLGANGILIWLRCFPYRKQYDPNVAGYCWPASVYPDYSMFSNICCCVADFALALLPWKIMWNLQIDKTEKFGIAVTMSTGAFAGIAAIIRTTESSSLTNDVTYNNVSLLIWTAAEVTITIIAASMPVLRVLFRNIKASTTNSYYGTGGQSNVRGSNFVFSQNQRTVASTGLAETYDNNNGSKDIILQDMASNIVQKTEIDVEYNAAEDVLSTDKELNVRKW